MKEYLISVGNATLYDINTGEVLFTSKTLMDDSIDISTSSSEVRAGFGNALQYIYYFSGKFEVKFTESQFSLNLIALNNGASIGTGKNIYEEESVTLSSGAGSVLGTPVVSPDGTAIYGWVTDKNGNTTKVTFSGKNFTLAGGGNDTVCVRYYAYSASAKTVQVSSNIVPSIARCVIEAQLGSADGSSNVIGKILIEIPRLQISGAQSISLKSDGVSNTPLSGFALAYNETSSGSCTSAAYYANITKVLNNSNWYDDVYALAVVDDTITVTTAANTATIDLRAIPTSGSAFKPPYADITFTSSDATKCTVSTSGVITKVANGSAVVSCTITSKTGVSANVDVTVS